MVQEADALLVWGGDVLYLCHWMRQSGLADLLPSLRRETVYVAVSAGSMVVTPNFGEAYDDSFCREPPASDLPAGDARALGLVDFSLFPHLDHERSPQTSLANTERWAAGIPVPTYAIDDQSAIKVTDSTVEVVTEGHCETVHPLGPMACASVRQCCLSECAGTSLSWKPPLQRRWTHSISTRVGRRGSSRPAKFREMCSRSRCG
jgi:dipeptidase E